MNTEFGVSSVEFVYYGYILQYCDDFVKKINGLKSGSTSESLKKLYDALYEFQFNNGVPIVIGIRGKNGNDNDAGHAIYPFE